jgi:TonB family protein
MSPSGTAEIPPPRAGGYVLRSDLAQYCLPSAQQDELRPLAYANAIALLFVAVASLGIRGPVFVIREPPRPEEPMPPIIVQMQPEDLPKPENISLEEPPPETQDTPVAPVIVAVADPTSVNFAVPAVGNVQIVNSAAYAAPPPADPQRYTPPPAPSLRNIRIGGGEFTRQDYDASKVSVFISRGMRGQIITLITVAPNGTVSDVQVEKGTGYPELDRFWVGEIRKWLAPVGEERRYRLLATI